jgi:hypothetical protein
MASGAGFVLAAGGIVAVNEGIFMPIEEHKPPWSTFNWRIVPATAILAILVTGAEKLNAPFGKALGMLVLLSSLVISYGNAPSPIENASRVLGVK